MTYEVTSYLNTYQEEVFVDESDELESDMNLISWTQR